MARGCGAASTSPHLCLRPLRVVKAAGSTSAAQVMVRVPLFHRLDGEDPGHGFSP